MNDLDILDAGSRRDLLARLLREKGERQVSSHPLSRGQQALWFLHQAAPDNPAYTIVFALRLRGTLDRVALLRALQLMVDRHQQLRANFRMQADGTLVQDIRGYRRVDLPVTLTDDAETVLRAAAARPFDLETDALFRPELVATGPEDHALLLSIHHIVFDGWSLWMVADEIRTAYEAFAAGREPALHPVRGTYVQHIERQEAAIAASDADVEWWTARLAPAKAALDLPFDAPRPPVRASEGAAHRFALDAALSAGLTDLARDLSMTPFTLMLGAWQMFLSRWSGQSVIPVGTRSAGRGPQDGDIAGYFVNPVVVIADIDPNAAAVDFLRAVHADAMEALAHDALPFPTIVERMNLRRDPSTTPLFQVSFVMQKAQRGGGAMALMSGEADWAGLRAEYIDLPQQVGQFDLDLEMFEVAGALRGVLKYDTALFQPGTIERLAENFAAMLAGLVADPSRPIDDLPIVSAASLALIAGFTAPVAAPIPATECVHDAFAAQVRRTPDAIALTCEGRHLTYDQLNRRANRLAHRLIAAGVRPDDLVGLCTDRDFEIVVGILAILKAGAAYLPLDPTLPADRVNYIMGDSASKLIVHQTGKAGVVDTAGAELIEMLPGGEIAGGWPEDDLPPLADLDGRIYVMYTSGTTGRPKGVQLSHRNVARLFLNTQDWYRFGPEDVWPLFHSFAFDVSVWEMWGALTNGGRLVVVPYVVSRSPALFVDLVRDEGVTVLNQSPSAFKLFVAEEGARPAPERFAMRAIIFAGEPLDLQSLRPWVARHGDEAPLIVNMYGITETTVHASYRIMREADLRRPRSTVGVAIPDLRLDLLDHRLRPVPIGAAGEIHVSGPGLAIGYLGRPDLTAEKFVTGPDGVQYYKSSDLARHLPDGDIEYLGRNDKQVKIRGFRIELGEIEGALCRHPDIRSAVTVAQDHPVQGRRLVAYVVGDATDADLRAHLARTLPDYMLPSVFMRIDAVPLNGNGKVNHALLPEPQDARDEAETFVAPRTEAEALLQPIWEKVLGIAPVGVNDDFFRLGGQSLLAVHLVSEAGAAFGMKLPTALLMRNPTIAAMAEAIGADAGFQPLVPMNRGSGTPLFCVAGGGGSTLYYQNMAKGMDLPFVGVQLRGTDGAHTPHDSVEAVAAEALEAIRIRQPQGPYRLAGHCFGGIVAFEIARRLEAAGEAVERLVIMDAPAPLGHGLNEIERPDTDDADWLAKVSEVLAESAEVPLTIDAAELRVAGDPLAAAAARIADAGLLPAAAAADHLRGFVAVFQAASRARYAAAGGIDAPITLIRAGDHHPDYDYSAADDAAGTLGWAGLTRTGCDAHAVPGTHLTMLSENNTPHVTAQMRSAFKETAR